MSELFAWSGWESEFFWLAEVLRTELSKTIDARRPEIVKIIDALQAEPAQLSTRFQCDLGSNLSDRSSIWRRRSLVCFRISSAAPSESPAAIFSRIWRCSKLERCISPRGINPK